MNRVVGWDGTKVEYDERMQPVNRVAATALQGKSAGGPAELERKLLELVEDAAMWARVDKEVKAFKQRQLLREIKAIIDT